MIVHTLFSFLEIFENTRYNVFLNQLFTMLMNGLNDQDRVIENLSFDGRVALILQEETPPARLTKIEFITMDLELFKFLKSNLLSLEIKDYLIDGDVIVLTLLDNQKMYFKYSSTPVDIIVEKGISFRNKTQIK